MVTTKGRLLIGTGISLGVALGFGSTAEAATDTITVTSLADPGNGDCAANGCTLREAITQADDGDGQDVDQIVFQSGLSGSISLAGVLPLIDENLYIDGPGVPTLQVEPLGESRILDINSSQRLVTVEGLMLTGGHAAGDGGAIRAINTQLSIRNSQISGNYADGRGGGVFVDKPGNIYSGALGIDGTTISGNQATGSGGGVAVFGVASIGNSTITGNHAEQGGGISVYDSAGYAAWTTISNSTIAHNYSPESAGIHADVSAAIEVYDSTIAGNHFGGVSPKGYVRTSNSVVADNAGGVVADVSGGHLRASFSLIEQPGGAVIESVFGPNITGCDPRLGPLADNGGPTQTMLPASTSPVIDAGGGAPWGQFDQRGQPRIFNVPDVPDVSTPFGPGADIGAVELQPSEYVPPPTSSATAPCPATALAPSAPSSGFNQKAAIKKCKKKRPKGSKKRKRCINKAKKKTRAQA
jgi:CSLREA domain-containing protein